MSKPSIQEQIKQKAKTVEETIHDEDQSLELCDMQCSHLCGCEGKCPFREHPHLVEVSDVLALLDGCVIIDKKDWRELADQITKEIDEFYGYHAEASKIVRKKFAELTEQ